MSFPELNQPETAADRRSARRFAIVMDLRWKLVRRRKVLDSGAAGTIDLSSGGILFSAGRPLPIGHNVELSILWPALLHNVTPMQLVVRGHIVRSTRAETAVRISQHEFRTAAGPRPIFPELLLPAELARNFEPLGEGAPRSCARDSGIEHRPTPTIGRHTGISR